MDAFLKTLLGFVCVIFGYGVLMGLWWNIQKIAMDKKVNSSVVRMISGLTAGFILIPLSFIFYGVPQGFLSVNVFGSFFIVILLNIVIAYCWVRAIEKTDPVVGSQVQVFGPIIALFVGKLLLNELPNIWGIVGIFITLIGVYIFYQEAKDPSFIGPIKRIIRERREWLIFALIAGICAGIAIPFDKLNIVSTNGMLAPGITLFLGWGLFYAILGWLQSRKQNLSFLKKDFVWKGKTIWLLIVIGLCFGIANGFQGIAYTLIPTAVMVGTLKRIDALWAVLFVLTIFKHNTRPFRASGAVLIFIGILVMGASNLIK